MENRGHQPEKTLLYKLIQENLLNFYHQMDRDYEKGIPCFVKKEFDEFLKCGVLAHGFLRVQCTSCNHEKLVAFSCKKRGFCPSCGARRMAEAATHLVDEVFPEKPMRQWVLTLNWARRLKRVFGVDIEVCSECGGKLKVISSIEEPEVIKKILNHLGLESGIPEPCSPRGPNRRRFSIFHESSSLENSDGEPWFSVMDSLIQKFTFPTKSGLES